ncbi:hypothetical protein VTL71DRAFT_15865 [Oculimacula yallundae]|uniref:Uncharacterized protein n=1 Tax=Oculimacula yallundae TaxID=86028 RepID=A0ABR4CCW7_9HELO
MQFTKISTSFLLSFLASTTILASPVDSSEIIVEVSLPDSAYELDASVPSITEFVSIIDGEKIGLDVRDLENRQAITDSNFRLYLRSLSFRTCVGNACPTFESQEVIRKDNCAWGRCQDVRTLDNMSEDLQLCNLPFSACRLQSPTTRWNLILRRTADAFSCEGASTLWLYTRPHMTTYASLHDYHNGRHIGWCWHEKTDKDVEYCSALPYTVQSLVRCAWLPL